MSQELFANELSGKSLPAKTVREQFGKIFEIPQVIVPIVIAAINFALNWIKGKLVAHPQYVEGVNLVQARLVSTVNALGDADDNDVAQLEAIWVHGFLNEDVTGWTNKRIEEVAAKITNEHARAHFLHTAPTIVAMLSLVTDENADNGVQIREMWGNYFRSEATKGVFAEHLVNPGLDAIANQIDPPARLIDSLT
jgi:hypothetical protein